MTAFELKIVTPERTFFEGQCVSLVLPTLDGAYGVLAGHQPIVTAVEPGVLRYRTPDDLWNFAAVGKGMAEVMQEKVILLVTTAEHPGEIDEQRAREAMERAQNRLKRFHRSETEYHNTSEAISRAKARIAAKREHRKEK